jgi:F-type H+-transporting ATPase subunit epsilon
MAQQIKFELVSPERILISEEVDMVVIPGTEGYFGVLARHAPLISSLRPGVIDVYEGATIAERIFVAGGFAEVTPVRCTVLADDAMNVAALDRPAVEAELSALNGQLAGLRDVADQGDDAAKAKFRSIERAAKVAAAKLEALNSAATH